MNEITLSKKYMEMFKDREDILFYFLYGGRAGSKSFTSSIYLANRLINGKGNLLYCRQYMVNVNTTIIPEFIQKIQLLNLGHLLKVNKDNITCLSNGNQLWFKGLESSEGTAEAGLKGIKSLACVLIDEFQEVKEENFDRLIGTVRDKGLNLKIICCLNPTHVNTWQYNRFFKGVDYNFSGIIDNKLYVYSSYLDSKQYLAESYINEIENLKIIDPVKYENQYLGKWLNEIDNPLLSKNLLDLALEKNDINDYDKIVVAIDPAVSTNKNSDNTGIAVCGKKDKDYYILHCEEKKYTPKEWAQRAFELYKQYDADIIVIEVNQGGEMCEQTLRQVCGNFIKIDKVRATKNKVIRFEPIKALYEQQLVHHKGRFIDLEYQLLTYSGSLKDKSPNSVDSMVWGITYLSTHGKSSVGFY